MIHKESCGDCSSPFNTRDPEAELCGNCVKLRELKLEEWQRSREELHQLMREAAAYTHIPTTHFATGTNTTVTGSAWGNWFRSLRRGNRGD